jgi:hypothetical protein
MMTTDQVISVLILLCSLNLLGTITLVVLGIWRK